MKNCPFCSLQERVLRENEQASLFLSNPRKVEGHFLVTPKRHVEKPWELTGKELQAIFELIFFAQKILSISFHGGSDIRQNYRPFMKQSRIKIDHVHYHVYPRQLEDNLYQKVERHETEMFTELTDEERQKMAELIGSAG